MECGSQSVDVARWGRPALEHAQDVLSGGLGQEWSINSCSFFGESFLCSFFVPFLLLVFSFLSWLCPSLQNSNCLFSVCLSTFIVFCSFMFRLESSLQKNNLSSSKLVFIRFGYRGFFFLSHAVRLWFCGL